MIKRECPDCGCTWFSAAENSNWECHNCGKILTPVQNESIDKPKVLKKIWENRKRIGK